MEQSYKLIGYVTVRNNMLVIVDPSYLQAADIEHSGDVDYIFFGEQDYKALAKIEDEFPDLIVLKEDDGYRIPNITSELAKAIDKIMDGYIVGYYAASKDFRGRATSATWNPSCAGEFPASECGGTAVAAYTADVNGVYPVYAMYDNEDRITGIEIKFF
jgi:hypothetical protein